ncbi:MAG: hypothetical protein WCG84_01915 [Candidatus Moraniibacteriota bacterium]
MFRYFSLFFVALIIFSAIEVFTFRHHLFTLGTVTSHESIALAENDTENESGDDERKTSTTTSSSSSTTKTVLVPQAPVTVTTWVPVTKQIPADGYGIDTDNDGLVDALDPHPTIPEQLFFTDTDGDGVPDSDDQFPGRNDFFAFPDDGDANMNGIIDSFETVYSPFSVQ